MEAERKKAVLYRSKNSLLASRSNPNLSKRNSLLKHKYLKKLKKIKKQLKTSKKSVFKRAHNVYAISSPNLSTLSRKSGLEPTKIEKRNEK